MFVQQCLRVCSSSISVLTMCLTLACVRVCVDLGRAAAIECGGERRACLSSLTALVERERFLELALSAESWEKWCTFGEGTVKDSLVPLFGKKARIFFV